MATFQQIPFAGDQSTQNVFRITVLNHACSDAPRVTAWDDFNCNTTAKESIAGTVGSGNLSQIFGFDTTAAAAIAGWALPLVETPGGVFGGGNRLNGNASFIQLGNPAVPPMATHTRLFSLAFGVAHDSTAGTAGHDCVIGITLFYTGTAPGLRLEYNSVASEVATWVVLNTQARGTNTPPALPNTITATGADSTTSNLDPVTKPVTGVIIAPEYWTRTL